MTTRRNNMFYYRGACSAYNTILKIMKEIKSDEERITMFEKLHQSWLKCANDYANGIHNTEIDSVTVFTESDPKDQDLYTVCKEDL